MDHDNARVIRGNIHNRRIRRNHLNRLLIHHDRLLVVGLENSVGHRRCADSLYRLQHVGLLVEHGLAKFIRPIKVLIHSVQHVRELQQHEHARIPLRIRLRFGLATILMKESRGLNHIQPRRRCRQDVGNERIRIERDRRYELIQIGRAHFDRRSRRRAARSWCLCPSMLRHAERDSREHNY